METETILQFGDEVLVSVLMRPGMFQLKEFGVELVQEHQNNMMTSTQHNTKSDPHYPCVLGGDLSMWEYIPGMYFLGFSKEYIESIPVYQRRWLNRFIMDSDEEDTGMSYCCIAMNYTPSKHFHFRLYSFQKQKFYVICMLFRQRRRPRGWTWLHNCKDEACQQ